jgi:hypothetical protein
MSRYRLGGGVVLALAGTTVQVQGIFDGVLEKAKKSAEQKARDRLNQRIDQTIDQGMNKTEEAVQCLATDTGCLKQARAQGRKVEVVDEAELDTLRYAVTDADCLKRAKSMGKKVEIID